MIDINKVEYKEVKMKDNENLKKCSKIIILRGNSGSGKTTIAKRLQKELGKGTMLISQDVVRREMLYVDDGKETKACGLLVNLIKYGRVNCNVVILEGILNATWYRELFEAIKTEFSRNIYSYYFDLPFEETLIRHKTKNVSNEFGESDMRKWWNEKDYIKIIPERLIKKEHSEDEIIGMIIKDIH